MEKAEIELEKGLNEDVVKKISELKHEPEWMREFRLKSYETFSTSVSFPQAPKPKTTKLLNITFNIFFIFTIPFEF